MKNAVRISARFCLFFGCFCLFFGCAEKKSDHLRIATAANMQYAMRALVKEFTANHKIGCDMIVSSSGKLTNQIKAGAPYDIFVSADMMYPEELHKKGLTYKKPEIYAYGQLVLWTIKDGSAPDLQQLTTPDIKHIAIANPKTAPYGLAAMQVLNYYKLKDSVQNKLVYGESIAQTNQFITSQAADIGFTAESVVVSPEMKGRGKYTAINTQAYGKIRQGIVRIKREKADNEAAQVFYDFIFSPEAQKILKTYGYAIPTT